jgi:hypothetical protein
MRKDPHPSPSGGGGKRYRRHSRRSSRGSWRRQKLERDSDEHPTFSRRGLVSYPGRGDGVPHLPEKHRCIEDRSRLATLPVVWIVWRAVSCVAGCFEIPKMSGTNAAATKRTARSFSHTSRPWLFGVLASSPRSRGSPVAVTHGIRERLAHPRFSRAYNLMVRAGPLQDVRENVFGRRELSVEVHTFSGIKVTPENLTL